MREFDVELAEVRADETLLLLDDASGRGRGYADGPERALLSALLFDGVQAYLMYATAQRGARRTRYREAFNWIESASSEYVFSFDSVCDALGIDPHNLRRGLANLVSSRNADWKRGRRNF